MSCDTLCKDQDSFNKALDNYTDAKDKEISDKLEKNRGSMWAAAILMLLLLVWAVTLAVKVKDGEHRILHIALALLVSPIYIISYFLSKMEVRN